MSLIFAPAPIEWFSSAAIGEVEQLIAPNHRGRVKFAGTTWFARFYQPHDRLEALPGTSVKILGREGLTLLIMPLEDGDGRSPEPNSEQTITLLAKRWPPLRQFISWFVV